MTRLHISDSFESIFKGDPEFEVHILGPTGSADSLNTMQCAGEHAGGPYVFDYNANTTTWTGSVLLFSKTQMAAFDAAYPGKAWRVFVVEDDDTSCVLKMDTGESNSLFQLLATAYVLVDGTKMNLAGFAAAGPALWKLLSSAAGFITSKDDLVGVALEDVVVSQYYPGSNWIIRGSGNTTTGHMKLEMKAP